MEEKANRNPKWLYLILLIAAAVLIYFMLQGTGGKHPQNGSVADDTMGNKQYGAAVLEKTPYYEIIQKDNLYFCNFYDESHSVVKEEGPMTRPPKVLEVEEGVFRLTVYAGTGIGTQWGYYYNAKIGVFSRAFQSIFDQCDGLVAYADGEKVIVQSIFDTDDYYKEIDNFSNDFSGTAEPFVEVKFINSCDAISITYYSGADYQKINEVFPLR